MSFTCPASRLIVSSADSGALYGQWLYVSEHLYEVAPGGKAGSRGGRGASAGIGTSATRAEFMLLGPPDSCQIRPVCDQQLALEISHRKVLEEQSVSFWCVGLGSDVLLDAACRFAVGAEGVIGPVNGDLTRGRGLNSQGLVLGVNPANNHIILVHLSDFRRLLLSKSTEIREDLAVRVAEIESLLSLRLARPRILAVVSPVCLWLGKGDQAVCVHGSPYLGDGGRGRGVALHLAPIGKASPFFFDGLDDSLVIRLASDPELSLEINHGKFNEAGAKLSLWNSSGKNWRRRFRLTASGHLTPVESSEGLVVGVEDGGSSLALTPPSSLLAIVFESEESSMLRAAAMLAERQAMQKRAVEIAQDPTFLEALRDKGFARVREAVPPHIVTAALRQINRELGEAKTSVDMMKGKSFSSKPEVVELFNGSILPHMMAALLGPPRHGEEYTQSGGQVALRFPGDFCSSDSTDCSPEHFARTARNWHIDGIPNDSNPGVSDHYGELKPFDLLCGVLLTDVSEPLSGELCVFPSSHIKLGQYFSEDPARLQELATFGIPRLPRDLPLGEPAHCIGKAGDAFIANYMTAHFVAPNTSPWIRYAVYFRVRGRRFPSSSVSSSSATFPPNSMLRPHCNIRALWGPGESYVEEEEDKK